MRWQWLTLTGASLQLLGFLAVFLVFSALHHLRYLVIFQNTDELRATGGFLGSYTVLDFSSQQPLRLQIRDMYEPSGVSMTLPSPPGQKEYLSEGKGMKLVDANWNPDFPSSAQQILEYFEHISGDPQIYDGVIAIPLSAVEKLLGIIGEVYLPDQQQTVTAETLAEILREDRGQFFPGSQEKAQSLQAFYTAFRLRLNQLTLREAWQLAEKISQSGLWREVQIFVREPALQRAVQSAGLDGALKPYTENEIFLMPVESNVGINKANRKVTREASAVLENNQLIFRTHFYNQYTAAERPSAPAQDTAPHLAYVNYYRLLVTPDLQTESVLIDGKPAEHWDEEEITASNGLLYKQIGFLVVVPEETRVMTEVRFTVPDAERSHLIIQRQIGAEYSAFWESTPEKR